MPDHPRLPRRTFLLALGATLFGRGARGATLLGEGASAGGEAASTAEEPFVAGASEHLLELAQRFEVNREGLAGLFSGIDLRRGTPSERARALAEDLLGDPDRVVPRDQIRDALVRRIEADFAEGLTEERSGWLLSRTELRLLELAAALAASDPALR